ncbi:MAG: hypothetical protein K5666_00470, partial [Bacilli bacterium]|nr:hypothetical protein [Bacilli bacterium]
MIIDGGECPMVKRVYEKLKNKKKVIVMLMVLLGLLSITIGSALITSTLSIVGNTTFKKNSWIIYFDGVDISLDSSSTEKP